MLKHDKFAYFYSLDGTKITPKSASSLTEIVREILKPLETEGKITNLQIKEPTLFNRTMGVKYSSKNRTIDIQFDNEPEKVRKLLNEAWRNTGKDIALNIIEINSNDFVCGIWYGGKIAVYRNNDISYIIKKLLAMYKKNNIIVDFKEEITDETGLTPFEIEFPNNEKQILTFFHNAENLTWFFEFIFHYANDQLRPSFVQAK